MKDPADQIAESYRRQAEKYDSSGIGALEGKRKQAVRLLRLQVGDHVVDIGCGTGLNFRALQAAVGPSGKITGVDLTEGMLEQAEKRINRHGWTNVELIQSDAIAYPFPDRVDGILSTFTFTFIPKADQVIRKGAEALGAGKHWVVLDMAWPRAFPLWMQRRIPLLSNYAITAELVQRRPWEGIQQAMRENLNAVEIDRFWLGFFYIACGTKPG